MADVQVQMPDAQAVVNQILAQIDTIVQKRVAEAIAKVTPSGGGTTPASGAVDPHIKFLAHMVYNLCMQTGMPFPKQLTDIKE